MKRLHSKLLKQLQSEQDQDKKGDLIAKLLGECVKELSSLVNEIAKDNRPKARKRGAR